MGSAHAEQPMVSLFIYYELLISTIGSILYSLILMHVKRYVSIS
jgi:hypothetical protein